MQAANYTNNGAPTTRTPSNTADAETTLGGHIAWNNAGTSFAASDAADLVLFGYTVPSPFNLAIYGVRIATVNLGAANGAAAYTIQYGLAVNHSAASLATVDTANTSTRAPRFIPLGFQSVAAAGPIGTPYGPDIIYTPQVPIIIQPGRRVSLVARVIGGSIATASQVIRTIGTFDALHE